MTDGAESDRLVLSDGSAGKEPSTSEGRVALLEVRASIHERLVAVRKHLHDLLAVPLGRRKLHAVAQAVGEGQRRLNFPAILEVARECVRGDVVDQRSPERVRDEVPVTRSDLGRTIQETHHRGGHGNIAIYVV